jgi:hypothetical protein
MLTNGNKLCEVLLNKDLLKSIKINKNLKVRKGLDNVKRINTTIRTAKSPKHKDQ